MRKAKKTSPVTLKANSLSELRGLQRQVSQHAANRHAGHSADPGHGSSDDRVTSAAQPRRRPHRFLPPNPGPVTATADQTRKNKNTPSEAGVTPHADEQHQTAARHAQRHVVHTPSDTPEAKLDDSDIALFRRVVHSVTPVTTSNRVLLPPEPPATPTQLRQRREHAMGQRITPALDVSDQYASVGIDHDDTVFLQVGQGPHLIKGLKKGKWPVQASLDLHGSTLDHARERMDRFIQTCRDHQIRCVRVVHGKGYGSKNGDPVLKETVRRWLSQLAVVQAYIECDEADGGAGAVLVLLSKSVP